MKVTNKAEIDDNVDDCDGEFIDTDLYNDPDVWAGIVKTEIISSNGSPSATDDGISNDPICVPDSGSTEINLFANDSDPDGDNLTLTKIAGQNVSDGDQVNVGKGVVTLVDADTGRITYAPTTNQPENFTYTIADGNGGEDQATVHVGPGTCGQLTIRIEDQSGNLVSGAEFAPEYDDDANGSIQPNEQLPTRGSSTGRYTYNVPVSDDPRLSRMNESLMQTIPAGYASSSSDIIFEKDVERVITASGPQDEPDDHTYQNITNKKSKLATDISPDGGNNPPEIISIIPSYTSDNPCKITLNESVNDPDGDSLTYEWYQGEDTSGEPDGTGTSHYLGQKSSNYSQKWTLWVSDGSLSDQHTQTIEASSACGA